MRTIHADTDALLSKDVRPAFLVDLTLGDDTHLYLWTGAAELSHAGQTWLPVGGNGTISNIGETEELRAEGIVLELSGVPSDRLATALSNIKVGKSATVHFVLLDEAGAIVGSAVEAFTGIVDTTRVDDDSETATIQVAVESEMLLLQRRRNRRYTNEDQHLDYPDDDGFEFVAAVARGQDVFGGIPINPQHPPPFTQEP